MNNAGDLLRNLPTDNNNPNEKELYYINNIFEKEQSNIRKLMIEFKDIVMISLLFLLVSIPYFDSIIKKLYPRAENASIMLIIKSVLFGLLYYMLKNLYTLRKK
jgi:hypothetical protein